MLLGSCFDEKGRNCIVGFHTHTPLEKMAGGDNFKDRFVIRENGHICQESAGTK